MQRSRVGVLRGQGLVASGYRLVLLDDFADERENEKGEDCAPNKRVDDHYSPPDDAASSGTENIGDNVPRLAEETAEDNE